MMEDDQKQLQEILLGAALNNNLFTEIGYITEALTIMQNGSDYIFQVLKDVSRGRHTYDPIFVEMCCCYLFGKGIEAVVKWGQTDDGNFSIYYAQEHLADLDLHAEVPEEFLKSVQEGSSFGSILFQTHMDWCENRIKNNPDKIDLESEIKYLFYICSLFGMSYALERKYKGNKYYKKDNLQIHPILNRLVKS